MTMSIQIRVDLVAGVGSDGRAGATTLFPEKTNGSRSAAAAASQMRPHCTRSSQWVRHFSLISISLLHRMRSNATY